jgi:hypothetical protein
MFAVLDRLFAAEKQERDQAQATLHETLGDFAKRLAAGEDIQADQLREFCQRHELAADQLRELLAARVAQSKLAAKARTMAEHLQVERQAMQAIGEAERELVETQRRIARIQAEQAEKLAAARKAISKATAAKQALVADPPEPHRTELAELREKRIQLGQERRRIELAASGRATNLARAERNVKAAEAITADPQKSRLVRESAKADLTTARSAYDSALAIQEQAEQALAELARQEAELNGREQSIILELVANV